MNTLFVEIEEREKKILFYFLRLSSAMRERERERIVFDEHREISSK